MNPCVRLVDDLRVEKGNFHSPSLHWAATLYDTILHYVNTLHPSRNHKNLISTHFVKLPPGGEYVESASAGPDLRHSPKTSD